MRVGAIVPAGGRGERLGVDRPKALVELAGRTLVEHAVDHLLAAGVTDVVVAAPAGEVDAVRRLLPAVTVVAGGRERQDSVRAGLAALDPSVDVVLVHDAARPLAPADVVGRVVAAVAAGADAVVPVVPVADTVKQVDGDTVVATVDRARLRLAQTPQGFRRAALAAAHEAGRGSGAGEPATDDAALVEAAGGTVRVVAGAPEAFKVTTAWDLAVARALTATEGPR